MESNKIPKCVDRSKRTPTAQNNQSNNLHIYVYTLYVYIYIYF
jgi:hypothetical protein